MRSVFSEPRLYPKSLSIDKPWFISYKDIDGNEQKVYGQMSRFNTVEHRLLEANKLLQELNDEWRNNTRSSLNGTLIKHLEFAIDTRKQGKKRKTKEGYDSKFNVFAEWYRKAQYPPVNDFMGIAFLNWLSKRESINSNTSINDYRRQLKTFFNDLIKFKYVTVNPFSLTQKLPQRTATNMWFSRELQSNLKKLMKENGDEQLWVCCLIQYYCFVRPGDEMRYLKISNIVVDGGDWKFRLSGSSLKTNKYRYVPIPEDLQAALKNYIAGYNDDDYLFGRKNTPGKVMIGRSYLYTRHRRYMQALDLPEGYSLYSWKNTGAVMMYKEGVKMKYISLLMGHSSIEITDEYFKSLGIDDVMDEVKINYPKIK
jgi:integrase